MYILSGVCREASFFSLITLEVLKKKKSNLQRRPFKCDFLASAEEGRAHAEVHPGSEHHHALLRAVGPGRGHRVHRPRSEHQHGGQQPAQRARALQDAQRVGKDGIQESR